MDISIIIVNYNTEKLLRECLESIRKYTVGLEYEIIVVDNASQDNSVEMLHQFFPEVICIPLERNIGFGPANNVGFRIARGKYIHFLNSDTYLLNNANKIYFDYFEQFHQKKKLGAIGSNLLNENGEVIHSYGKFLSFKQTIKNFIYLNFICFIQIFNSRIRNFEVSNIEQKKTGLVDYITGASLFMPRNENAIFDEDFFLYFEESYMQKKLQRKGLSRILIDDPKIVHLYGGSISKNNGKNIWGTFSYVNFLKSMIIYNRKIHRINSVTTMFLLFLAILIQMNPIVGKEKTIFNIRYLCKGIMDVNP